jgi:indole-3-glycerol phosphate synthase
MSVLTEILARKRQRLAEAKTKVPVESLRERITPGSHRFLTTLQRDGVNVIAEFKRRSPSKGIIRADVDAPSMARCYEAGGAAAISVLTEEDYFAGSLDDLRSVKSVVALPVLRKDFVFDDYQIYEAAAAGADAVLLIVAALDDEQLSRLRQLAEGELGLDALVEVHDSEEMNRAAAAGAKLIGVNNRNLHTFEVSLQTSVTLADIAPKGSTLISESGLRNAEDLDMLRGVGYQGFLIGETLMRADRPDEVLRSLL